MHDFFILANYYYNFGFNVTCITNEVTPDTNPNGPILKNPCHKWQNYSDNRQELDVLRSYPWSISKGIGIVLGYNGLRALDIDECNDFSIIDEFLTELVLPTNYEWVVKSGSGKGFHILFYSDDHNFSLFKSKIKVFKSNERYQNKFKLIELRWIGHLVLPPSIHPSVNHYSFLNNSFPRNCPRRVSNHRVHRVIRRFCAFKSVQTISLFNEGYIETHENDNYVKLLGSNEVEYVDPYFIFFDTETTGSAIDINISYKNSANWPRIVQLGWIFCDRNGNILNKKQSIIKPEGFEIPLESTQIHKITTKQAIDEGENLRDVLFQFYRLQDNIHVKFFVAHNSQFDMGVINAEFYRLYKDSPLLNVNTICTMKETVDFCKLGNFGYYKWPKLTELYNKVFQQKVGEKHNALHDAEMTMKCYWQLRDLNIFQEPAGETNYSGTAFYIINEL